MTSNMETSLQKFREKNAKALKTRMDTADITSASGRGASENKTLMSDLLESASQDKLGASDFESSLTKRQPTTAQRTSSSNLESNRLLAGLDVGTNESAKEVEEAFRFTKDDQKAFEQKNELKSSLASQDLGYVTRSDLEQLRKLKESGNAREYEMMRMRLLEKKQHNERIEQQNVATWDKIKTNINTVLSRRVENMAKLEKQLGELNKMIGASNVIGDKELKLARAIDDQYMDLMQFSFFNMMTAPERMLAAMSPQLVDAFMNTFRIVNALDDFNWTYQNPLNNFFMLQYTNQPTTADRAQRSFGMDANTTMANGSMQYRGPHHPLSQVRTIMDHSDGYGMMNRGPFLMEPNLYDVVPYGGRVMTTANFTQAITNNLANPAYADLIAMIPAIQHIPDDASQTVAPDRNGFQDAIPVELVQSMFYTAGGRNIVVTIAELLQRNVQSINGISGFRGVSMSGDLVEVYLLANLYQLHKTTNSVDSAKKSVVMTELTKLNKLMPELENTTLKTLREVTKNLVTTLVNNRTTLFHMAGVGCVIGQNLMFKEIYTVGSIGLERYIGTNMEKLKSLLQSISETIYYTVQNITVGAAETNRLILISTYRRLLLCLKFMIVTGSKMYPVVNKHNDFNEDSKLGHIYIVLRKLFWKIVFADNSNINVPILQTTNTAYLLSKAYVGWLKTQLLNDQNHPNEFNAWFQYGTNPNVSFAQCQEYRALLDRLINANNYGSFSEFEIHVVVNNNGAVGMNTTPVKLLQEYLRYVQEELSTDLPSAALDTLNENISLTGTSDSDMIMF